MEKEADRTAEIEARVAKADQEAAVAELAAEKDAELKRLGVKSIRRSAVRQRRSTTRSCRR
jgi:hypothetical protein